MPEHANFSCLLLMCPIHNASARRGWGGWRRPGEGARKRRLAFFVLGTEQVYASRFVAVTGGMWGEIHGPYFAMSFVAKSS